MAKRYSTKTEYYYCPDYNRYVKRENGRYFCIKNGKEEFSKFYLAINIGEIYTVDITKERYYAQLN